MFHVKRRMNPDTMDIETIKYNTRRGDHRMWIVDFL